MSRFSRIAAASFYPSPLDVPGVLIRAHYPGQELLPGYDFTNGWRDLFAPGLEIVEVAGDHVTMANDENGPALGRQINAVLDRHFGNLSYHREHRRPAQAAKEGILVGQLDHP